MRYFIHALILAAFTACAVPGTDLTVACPDSSEKSLTREQWKACYGYQDKESSGSH